MLHQRFRAADARPTEAELQAIAKAAYGERLAQFCDEQRQMPQEAEAQSLANRTFADLYQRMIDHGGHVPVAAEEETALISRWGNTRVEKVKELAALVDAGYQPIKGTFVDGYLRDHGFQPQNGLRRMVMPVLYEAYRDACRDAEAVRQGYPPASRFAVPGAPQVELVATPDQVDPADARADLPMSEFVDQAIADNIVEDIWDKNTGKQARSTVSLFELLIGKRSFSTYTQRDFATFKRRNSSPRLPLRA